METLLLLLSTFPNAASARAAAHTLVEERLAACGSLLPQVESIYRWKGEIEVGAEVFVIFKTTVERADAAQERLRTLHPYEVPEIIRVPVTGGWPEYLSWVEECVQPETEPAETR